MTVLYRRSAAEFREVRMDVDPRDSESRDQDLFDGDGGPSGRSVALDRDPACDWRQRETQVRDGNDRPRDVGRGPGSNDRDDASSDGQRGRADSRWPDRQPESRELDPRDVFRRDLTLPRGAEREIAFDVRERAYTLR